MHLLLAAAAFACEQPVYTVLALPEPDGSGHGAVTGEATVGGRTVVGGRFSYVSQEAYAGWRTVLLDAPSQDEWLPARFGTKVSDAIDPTHMYLLIDIGLLFDSVHIQRQLVAEVRNVDAVGHFRTCWWMVDPTPWKARVPQNDVPWENSMYGAWEATPRADGGTLVSYQFWSEPGRIPSAVQRFGLANTLPALIEAFDARVKALGGG